MNMYLDNIEGNDLVFTSAYNEFPEFFTDDINSKIKAALERHNELIKNPKYADGLKQAFLDGQFSYEELQGMAIWRTVTSWTDARPLTRKDNALEVFKIYLAEMESRYLKYPVREG